MLAAILVQQVAVAQPAPSLLCFCESAASKPANNGTFAWLDGLPLLVIAVAVVVASLMVFLLLRMMREDSGTVSSGKKPVLRLRCTGPYIPVPEEVIVVRASHSACP